MKGMFITLEGIEGAGKSSQLPKIKAFLEEQGHLTLCLREPGGTPVAEEIRILLKTKRQDDEITPLCELLLMYAARVQLVETVIKPALADGVDVICDRHDLSTVAYQGAGRKLSQELIAALKKLVLGDFAPDLILLFDLSPQLGMMRIQNRGSSDRFESASLAFFKRVRECYLKCAAENPELIKTVDASQSEEALDRDIRRIIKRML
ncbi:MAG: dTMP kinase [Succinivibrio sp.]|nr:dTMP kinase [Succinivibrio sp.]